MKHHKTAATTTTTSARKKKFYIRTAKEVAGWLRLYNILYTNWLPHGNEKYSITQKKKRIKTQFVYSVGVDVLLWFKSVSSLCRLMVPYYSRMVDSFICIDYMTVDTFLSKTKEKKS